MRLCWVPEVAHQLGDQLHHYGCAVPIFHRQQVPSVWAENPHQLPEVEIGVPVQGVALPEEVRCLLQNLRSPGHCRLYPRFAPDFCCFTARAFLWREWVITDDHVFQHPQGNPGPAHLGFWFRLLGKHITGMTVNFILKIITAPLHITIIPSKTGALEPVRLQLVMYAVVCRPTAALHGTTSGYWVAGWDILVLTNRPLSSF